MGLSQKYCEWCLAEESGDVTYGRNKEKYELWRRVDGKMVCRACWNYNKNRAKAVGLWNPKKNMKEEIQEKRELLLTLISTKHKSVIAQ